jgi:hypothetical protein
VRNLFAVLAFCLITGVAGSTVVSWSIAAHGLHAPSMPRTEASIDQPQVDHEPSPQPLELNIETTTLPADMDPYAGSMMTFPLR